MRGWMDEWVAAWTNECVDGVARPWLDRWQVRAWLNGRMRRWVHAWMGRWVNEKDKWDNASWMDNACVNSRPEPYVDGMMREWIDAARAEIMKSVAAYKG